MKCEYCDSIIHKRVNKCPNCGAPIAFPEPEVDEEATHEDEEEDDEAEEDDEGSCLGTCITLGVLIYIFVKHCM